MSPQPYITIPIATANKLAEVGHMLLNLSKTMKYRYSDPQEMYAGLDKLVGAI